MFGFISKMADEQFEIFILLTTDNVYLETQTYQRALRDLEEFDICNERDELRFKVVSFKKPVLLILKKNTNVLKRWRNIISSSNYCEGRPLVILDDEADAASLNTLVNKDKVSQINRRLTDIKKLATGSIYIEVTATPQSVILQSNLSTWKPQFTHYFSPGSAYIGGQFIYSDPISYCIKFTDENELDDIKLSSDIVPLGLRNALLTYLVICANFRIQGKPTCNFLVHPSVKTIDHERFAGTLGENLNSFLIELGDDEMRDSILEELKEKWIDLQSSQPDIAAFDDVKKEVENILEKEELNTIILNSKNPRDISYDKGFNIVVGGNSLGRGVTFPSLQVVYYCRKSKTPQADTFWQHSRIFGYDRVKGLIRIFIPPSLHQLFTVLNNSNKILIDQITQNGLDGLQLIYPDGINPTRKNVVHNQALNLITGGVNFFARNPSENDPAELDKLLEEYKETQDYYEVSGDFIVQLLRIIEPDNSDWNGEKYANCVVGLQKQRPLQKFALGVRRNRDIGKDTGTLLSPTDQNLSKILNTHTVLLLYRVKGNVDKKWKGNPFWIPNIRFPDGLNFFDMVEI